ncbi:MAG: CopG family transcriptional regulator [Clostridia bacterium]|nr:CopG family transcriptional regulator [Clostridia bacterium]
MSKLVISRKPLQGDDGYKTFSVRIKKDIVKNLDKLSKETDRSRNEIINILLNYAIENSIVNKTNEVEII